MNELLAKTTAWVCPQSLFTLMEYLQLEEEMQACSIGGVYGFLHDRSCVRHNSLHWDCDGHWHAF